MLNRDFSLKLSFPRSGQSSEVDLLCRRFSMNWIPACAGMTNLMKKLG
jgi:hypothetical protein